MKRENLKYYIIIILIFVIDSLHYIVFDNNDMYDIYYFYDKKRYLTNILYDISNYFRFSSLLYILKKYNKRVFNSLFITSLFSFLLYFINYNQIGGLVLIPLYLLITLYLNTWGNK